MTISADGLRHLSSELVLTPTYHVPACWVMAGVAAAFSAGPEASKPDPTVRAATTRICTEDIYIACL